MAKILNKVILITGEPGVGKTTLLKKISERLKSDGITSIKGFYTQEVRDSTRNRIGFDIIDINDENKNAILARTSSQPSASSSSYPMVGKYAVDIDSFESIAVPALGSLDSTRVFMIDEIGKMEMFSKTFIKLIDQMIAKVETQKFIFIATVPTKPLRLADKLKDLPFSRIFEVSRSNRDKIFDDVYEAITEVLNNI